MTLRVHITTCHGKFRCSLHIWQVTVNRNSEESLLVHNFQPWQRSSGNSIKSSTIALNRYWNLYSLPVLHVPAQNAVITGNHKRLNEIRACMGFKFRTKTIAVFLWKAMIEFETSLSGVLFMSPKRFCKPFERFWRVWRVRIIVL